MLVVLEEAYLRDPCECSIMQLATENLLRPQGGASVGWMQCWELIGGRNRPAGAGAP